MRATGNRDGSREIAGHKGGRGQGRIAERGERSPAPAHQTTIQGAWQPSDRTQPVKVCRRVQASGPVTSPALLGNLTNPQRAAWPLAPRSNRWDQCPARRLAPINAGTRSRVNPRRCGRVTYIVGSGPGDDGESEPGSTFRRVNRAWGGRGLPTPRIHIVDVNTSPFGPLASAIICSISAVSIRG